MRRFFSNSLTLTWREIESIFYSPLSYIVLTMFLILNGLSFYFTLRAVGGDVTNTITYFLGLNELFWMGILLIPPIITMRLLAEEKKTGTIELLMTAPVSDLQVVLAKFLGTLVFFAFLWLPSLIYIIIMKEFGGIPDNGIILSAYAGIFLLGSSLIALGLFTSSLSGNQILAAVTALVANLIILTLPWIGELARKLISKALFFAPGLQEKFLHSWVYAKRVLDQLSVYQHFQDTFSKGILDSFHLVFYLGLTAFFLFLAVRSLEARKWQ